jgi:hypothetical protein
MNTLETFIFKKINDINDRMNNLNESDYSQKDYEAIFNRLSGQKDILYLCLTANDNTYCQKK